MTNIELVEYAKKCLSLGEGSVYVYGAYGNKLTTSFCTTKYKQYPNINTYTRTEKYKKLCDSKHYGFDCVGLIKSFYWGGFGSVKYKSSSDLSANGMYNKATVKGNISTMNKEKIGLLVHMNGHIGIYIGNNEVIECTISTVFAKQNHKLGGVCKTKLSDRKWLHWLECPFITYVSNNTSKGTIMVKDGTWNIRSGPGTSYDVVKTVKTGQLLSFYGKINNWYQVDGGYISTKAVKPKETFSVKVYMRYTGNSNSIVDALKSIGVDSSFNNRKNIAKKNGINVYLGLPFQNMKLLNLLKQGELLK